jgi:hypothetical protein
LRRLLEVVGNAGAVFPGLLQSRNGIEVDLVDLSEPLATSDTAIEAPVANG